MEKLTHRHQEVFPPLSRASKPASGSSLRQLCCLLCSRAGRNTASRCPQAVLLSLGLKGSTSSAPFPFLHQTTVRPQPPQPKAAWSTPSEFNIDTAVPKQEKQQATVSKKKQMRKVAYLPC